MTAAVTPVLAIEDLSVVYRTPTGDVKAVAGVNLSLHAGEVVGLTGESGSGKSTLAYGACRLLRAPALITGGRVRYEGRRSSGEADILALTRRQLQRVRWREIAIVFQSAMNALNPVLSVRDQLLDGMHAHLQLSKPEALAKVARLLDLVGIPRSRLRSYPHELSGGMRQRVMIAMALASDPEIVIMDEPTTALDVVVQREILAQIVDLKEQLGFAILFITHDLSLLLELADRIAVMYAGQLLEIGTSEAIHHETAHPYTNGLLHSFPSLRGPRRDLAGIPGSPPDLHNPPAGCPFRPRCTYAGEPCTTVDMSLRPVGERTGSAHLSACPFVGPADFAAPSVPSSADVVARWDEIASPRPGSPLPEGGRVNNLPSREYAAPRDGKSPALLGDAGPGADADYLIEVSALPHALPTTEGSLRKDGNGPARRQKFPAARGD